MNREIAQAVWNSIWQICIVVMLVGLICDINYWAPTASLVLVLTMRWKDKYKK